MVQGIAVFRRYGQGDSLVVRSIRFIGDHNTVSLDINRYFPLIRDEPIVFIPLAEEGT